MFTDKMAQDYAAMNEALNAEQQKAQLPTRAEVLEALAESDMGMPDLIEDAPLNTFEVIFRASPTWAKEIDGEVELNAELPQRGGPVRCIYCERRAGEVTVVVDGIDLDGTKMYACKGACGAQDSFGMHIKRMERLHRHTTMHLTASDRALRWVTDAKDGTRVEYALTTRAVARRKNVRKQQAASRRANRAR